MKQQLTILFSALILVSFANAQDSKFSAILGYPIALGDNFLANYTGIVDAGLQYRFLESSAINFGISTNAGYFKNNNGTSKDNVLLVQPRAFGEVNAEALNGFRPFFGLGYTFVSSKIVLNSDQTPDIKDNTGAINFNLGAAYDITQSLFGYISYDYLNISRDNPNQDNSYFKSVNILKLGLGLRF